jgi:hypothetical protein
MEKTPWFKQKVVRDREEYEAMIEYFCDSLCEELSYKTIPVWEDVIARIWKEVFGDIDVEENDE